MVASTAHVKTFINQRGNIPIFRTNTNKQNIRRAKNKERKNKNRTKAIELPRLKSSLNFSLWAINGPGVFFFSFFLWLMAYPQPIESMAYNRWIYGHNDLKERFFSNSSL